MLQVLLRHDPLVRMNGLPMPSQEQRLVVTPQEVRKEVRQDSTIRLVIPNDRDSMTLDRIITLDYTCSVRSTRPI